MGVTYLRGNYDLCIFVEIMTYVFSNRPALNRNSDQCQFSDEGRPADAPGSRVPVSRYSTVKHGAPLTMPASDILRPRLVGSAGQTLDTRLRGSLVWPEHCPVSSGRFVGCGSGQ